MKDKEEEDGIQKSEKFPYAATAPKALTNHGQWFRSNMGMIRGSSFSIFTGVENDA